MVFTLTEKKPVPEDPHLDLRCREILVSLLVIGKKIRFKNLQNFLIKNSCLISKPTLSKHLKHLRDKGLIKRNIPEPHHTTYEINHKIFGDLKKISNLVQESLKTIAEEEKIFNSIPLDHQITIIIEKIILRNLRRLKTNIELELNPSKKWEKLVELEWLANPIFKHHEDLLISKCKKDKKYRELVIQKLDENIEQIKELNTSNG